MLDLISKFICPFISVLQFIVPPFKYEEIIKSERNDGNIVYYFNTK